ncbi:MAG: hypothetical protein WC777_06010 [Candidatus Gracilibacteria bacterium]
MEIFKISPAGPELDELSRKSLVEILEDWDARDTGGTISSATQGVSTDFHPELLQTYSGRKRHKDKGIHKLHRFGDEEIQRTAQERGIQVQGLIPGSFCVDLEARIIAHHPRLSMRGRDDYRKDNPMENYRIRGTAIDLVRELVKFKFRLYELLNPYEGGEYRLGKEINHEALGGHPIYQKSD